MLTLRPGHVSVATALRKSKGKKGELPCFCTPMRGKGNFLVSGLFSRQTNKQAGRGSRRVCRAIFRHGVLTQAVLTHPLFAGIIANLFYL